MHELQIELWPTDKQYKIGVCACGDWTSRHHILTRSIWREYFAEHRKAERDAIGRHPLLTTIYPSKEGK